ncbi:MAG TPA: endonuclease/exonuclease/phosphatase family protein [Rhodothermales bacterium]|nr:endonuclease/exonuclease/phosphatase family protein [Rhodothermales bacterium]
MRKKRGFLVALIFLMGCAGTKQGRMTEAGEAATPLRVMTFNIRYNNPGDGVNAWPNRKDKVASMIRLHGADLIGLQEVLKDMLDELDALLPEYNWLGVGRADGQETGEYSAILYRKSRFEVLDQGTFWLSETPEVPGSKSWDAAIERIATWAQFRDRITGEVFYHFNTHYDHIGEQAREESSLLLKRRIAEIAKEAPAVLTGDFNVEHSAAAYQALVTGAGALQDVHDVSTFPHHGPTSTWNGFDAIEPGRWIDFIFVRGPVVVGQHAVLSDTWDGLFPSDHLPVLTEISWTP